MSKLTSAIETKIRKECESQEVVILLEEIDRLRQANPDHSCTLGVGCGDGELFVHGDYESIKACQKLILERSEFSAALQRVQDLNQKAMAILESMRIK
jgi:hypothetical protein